MLMLSSPGQYYRLVDREQANIVIQFKCRGIDPWVKQNEQIVRLTSINPILSEALQKTKQRSIDGWPIETRNLYQNQ